MNLTLDNNMYERLYSATIGGVGGIISIETTDITTILNPYLIYNINIGESVQALLYGAIGALGGLLIREIFRCIKIRVILMVKKRKLKRNNNNLCN